MTIAEWKDFVKDMNILTSEPIIFHDIIITIKNIKMIKHLNYTAIQPHIHSYFELTSIVENSTYTKIGDSEFIISAGDAILLPPGTVHSHRKHKTSEYRDICISFTVEKLPIESKVSKYDIFYTTLQQIRPYSFDAHIETLKCTKNLHTSQAIFLQWLFSLLENWNSNDLSFRPPNATVTMIKEYINNNYSQNFRTENLSKALNISYRHLARIFKQETNMSIVDFLNSVRLEHAKNLLLQTDLPISDIAVQTGYDNIYYFSKIFKKNFFISPSQFRKMDTYIEG